MRFQHPISSPDFKTNANRPIMVLFDPGFLYVLYKNVENDNMETTLLKVKSHVYFFVVSVRVKK